jgi:hypothetical protein
MADDDMRNHLVLYGFHYNNWGVTFGRFSDNKKVLLEDYISDSCSTTETSVASDVNEFIFPFHIKKKYFIEGTIKGQITIAATTSTSTVTSYRVTLCKINENSDDLELFTTGWVTVNDTLTWDAIYSIGEEKVYSFWIDAWEYATLSEKDRIYLKVEVNSDKYGLLWHSNDSTYNDLYIDIPLRT